MEKLRFVLTHPKITERVQDWLKKYDHEVPMEVVIKPYKKNRSLEQNDMFHAWCGSIADHTGHTKAEIKDMMVESVFGSMDYINLQGKVRTRLMGTSEMNVNEMSQLLERTVQVGVEFGASPPEIRYG